MSAHPLGPLAHLPGVAEAVAEARTACEELRWHPGLRHGWAAARAEAGVRCAQAGAALDGVRVPLATVRDVASGAAAPPAGPEGDHVLGALRVQAQVGRLMPPPGEPGTGPMPFAQLLARLHVAAVGGAPGGGEPGRPRGADQPADLRGLGVAPVGAELAQRLAGLADLLALPPAPDVPGVVLAAVVHAELLALRPFGHGNGFVARAVFRHQLTATGVDPIGAVVAEVAWAAEPPVYLAGAAGFATGQPERVAAWLRRCAAAVVRGAAEGRTVADALVRGQADGAP